MRASLLLLLVPASLAAAQTVAVRGIAYDSLQNAPLAGAFVTVQGTRRAAAADAHGAFAIDSVPIGPRVFLMQHEALDALGIPSVARRIDVSTGTGDVVVAVPSFGTFWRQMCGGPPPRDSAIVFGAVTNASHKPAANASVAVAWLDLVVNTKSVSQHRREGRVTTDSAGRFALCGIPMSTGLTLRATKDSTDSGVLDVLPLEKSVRRRDIQLNAPNASPFGTVTGTVTVEGREPTGVRVAIEGLPEVRVKADGQFTIRNVPVGTRQIEATFVGMSPAIAAVDVVSRGTTAVELELKQIVALPGVTVTGSAVRTQAAREFEQRRAEGLGRYADSTQIAKYPSLESFFQDLPFTFVKGAMGKRAIYIGSCPSPARLIVDGIVTAPADFAWRDQRDIAALETYDHVVPMEFQAKVGKPCGLVVVWTKNRFP